MAAVEANHTAWDLHAVPQGGTPVGDRQHPGLGTLLRRAPALGSANSVLRTQGSRNRTTLHMHHAIGGALLNSTHDVLWTRVSVDRTTQPWRHTFTRSQLHTFGGDTAWRDAYRPPDLASMGASNTGLRLTYFLFRPRVSMDSKTLPLGLRLPRGHCGARPISLGTCRPSDLRRM